MIENKKTGDYVQIECGKCNFCLANFRDDWAFRMNEEQKVSNTSHFMTLTYDGKHVPRVWTKEDKMLLSIQKTDLYRFLKSLKEDQRRTLRKDATQWKIKYFAVGEYGTDDEYIDENGHTRKGTMRPHYHLITFNVHPITLERINSGMIWGKGRVDASPVETGGASTYTTKYLIDRTPFDDDDPREPVFRTMSRGKGLGARYLESNRNWHRAPDEYYPDNFRMYRMENGYMKRLPRYYKNDLKKAHREDRQEILDDAFKIYNEETVEKMNAQYKEEIERLRVLHPRPEIYYLERLKQQHDQIRIKSRKLNRL